MEAIVVYGAFGGRLDHTMRNLRALFYYQGPIVMMSEDSIAFKVPEGHTIVKHSKTFESLISCGILPASLTHIRTLGLRWNLGEAPWNKTSLETHISTSNERTGDETEFWTEKDIVWIGTMIKQ